MNLTRLLCLFILLLTGGAELWGKSNGISGGAGGIGGLLAITRHDVTPARTLHPVYDGNGNLTGLLNGTTWQRAATYEYGPFGEILRASGPEAAANRHRFSGKFTDPTTGLHYFGHRWYDPDAGRWLSRDPLGEGEAVNLYAYFHNDPVNRADILGDAQVMLSTGEVGSSFSPPADLRTGSILGGGGPASSAPGEDLWDGMLALRAMESAHARWQAKINLTMALVKKGDGGVQSSRGCKGRPARSGGEIFDAKFNELMAEGLPIQYIMALDAEILELDQTIAARESEMNAIIYRLYGLSPEEISMVEAG